MLLDPVGGDVDNEGAGLCAGPVWSGGGRDGPKAPGVESGANPEGRRALGPSCLWAVPAPGLGPARGLLGTVTIHTQHLLCCLENSVLTLATPRPPAWLTILPHPCQHLLFLFFSMVVWVWFGVDDDDDLWFGLVVWCGFGSPMMMMRMVLDEFCGNDLLFLFVEFD